MRSESSTDTSSSPQHQLIQSFIYRRFEDIFLNQSRRAQIGMLLAASVIAAIWFNRTQSLVAVTWEVTVLAVTTWRMRFTNDFVRAAPEGGSLRRIAALLVINGVLMALPLLDFWQFDAADRAAISIILLTTATASTVTTSGHRSLFLAFATPMLVPLAGAWLFIGGLESRGTGEWGLAALIIVFLLFLVSLGRQVNEVFEESSRYRYGEQQLNIELTQALERAAESNRAKTQFLAAASHDLRQPIHTITVLVAALTLRKIDPGSRRIVTLLDSVNQTLSKQLDSLLDISRLDAGIVSPKLAPCRLDTLLIAHQEATQAVAADRGITLELHCSERMTAITDEALFTRILQNLTDNALKFTPHGGRIYLSLQRDGDGAVLAVTDNGIGMAAAEHDRVFHEFYQVANVERDRTKGLGLGLSIVKRLCGLLDMELSLASTLGVGTTMTLRLPLSRAEGRLPAAPATLDLRDVSVLVIDDEAMVRESMQMLLSELGCRVHLADSGQQAAAIVAAEQLDVILSDLRLRGGESGITVLEQLRLVQPGAIAAFITGDTAPERLSAANATGLPVLIKPVGLPELTKVLRTMKA